MFEDAQGGTKVEFLVHHSGRVDLNAVEGQLFFLFGQELGGLRVVGKDPEGKDGKDHG